MKLLIFSIFDKAVNAFNNPFYARAKGEAVRMFTQAVNDPQSPFSKSVLDFTLMYLGEFDDNSGLFSPAEPQRVIAAHECVDPDASPKSRQ